tara:strand:+ start:716 stop:3526 length:2811 start_codon:yes stop_codon:yes gene_type:complete
MIPATSLKQFLNNHYCSNGNKSLITHTRIKDSTRNITGGIYIIPDEKKEQFFNIYHKHVFVDNNPEYLTEKQLTNGKGPILIDLDFRYLSEITERQHSQDFIEDICVLYLQKINEIKNFEKYENLSFPIYVFEKPNVNILPDDSKTKDGIHIIIGIQSSHEEQCHLREIIKTELKEIIDSHELPITNSIDDVLDKGISRGETNWQMYGSQKPGNESYRLVSIYDIKYTNESDDFAMNIQMEVNFNIHEFNLKKNLHKLSARYEEHIEIETRETVKQQLVGSIRAPRKIRSTRKETLINNNGNNQINYDYITDREKLNEVVEIWLESSEDYRLKEIHKYTMCLSEDYYSNYDKWMRVGCALVHTDTKLLLTWIAFCAQWKNFRFDMIHIDDNDNIINYWKGFSATNSDSNLTSRSIMYWAKQSNPEEYKKIHDDSLDYYIDESIKSGTEVDIAKLLFKLYSSQFVCVNINKNIWYEFINHKWTQIDSGVSLRRQIHDGLMEQYALKIRSLVHKQIEIGNNSEGNEEALKKIKEARTNAIAITIKIKKTADKNNIMRECKDLFYDKKFLDKMDQNPYLLCFDNGVFDFKEKVFRDGCPEDYITRSTNINYLPKKLIPKFQQYEEEINDFIDKLFPEEDLKNYMWDHLASTLIGINHAQTVNIYTGSGSNGKSLLVKLMEKVMGDYKGTFPLQLITQKRTSIGTPTPEVAQLFGIRYAVINEPSKGDQINEGTLKEISGGDKLQGRLLHQDTITFTPQFKLAVCTNTLFDIKAQDAGTWRRIRVCPYKSKFVDKPRTDDPDEPYQFKKDDDIEGEKFPRWIQPFMAMLIERAVKTNGKVKDCKIVTEASENYRDDQDYLSEFIKTKINREDPEGRIQKTEVAQVFKAWYQLEYSGSKVPKSKELYARLEKEFGKYTKYWKGGSIIYSNDEDEEYSEVTN